MAQGIPPNNGIAPYPFGLGGVMFPPYPFRFEDMFVGPPYYSARSSVQPLIPPSNASSPPIYPPLYQQPHSLPNDISKFSAAQNLSWNNGMLDNGNAAIPGAPQHPYFHLPSGVQPSPHNMALQHPGQLPPAMLQNHSQSLLHGYSVNLPGMSLGGKHMPSHNEAAPGGMLPAAKPSSEVTNMPLVVAQRLLSFTIQYAGVTPPGALHNFNQPPSNVRYDQSPAPLRQDAQCERGLALPPAAMIRAEFTVQKGNSSPKINRARRNQQANHWGPTCGNSNIPSSRQMRHVEPQPSVGRVRSATVAVTGRKSSRDGSVVNPSIGQGRRF